MNNLPHNFRGVSFLLRNLIQAGNMRLTQGNLNRIAAHLVSITRPRSPIRSTTIAGRRYVSAASAQRMIRRNLNRTILRVQGRNRNSILGYLRQLGANDNFITNLRRRLNRAARTPSPPRITGSKRRSPPPPPPSAGGIKASGIGGGTAHVSVRGSKRARSMAGY